jgi:DNA-binding LacI/PurR family transcriptional regulator
MLHPHPLKYHRIADELRRQAAQMPAGARLPSERALAKKFACNVLTVRKGLSSLVAEGRIERRLGSGTFVVDRGAESVGRSASEQVALLAFTGADAYGQQLMQALARVAVEEEVQLSTAWFDDFGERTLQEVESLARDGCTSLVLPWFPHAMRAALEGFVKQCPLPISLPLLIPGLERYCFERPDCFGSSTLQYTTALCRYFWCLGHRRIALLGPNEPADPILQAKLGAYSCTVSDLGTEQLCGLIGPTAAEVDALAKRWAEFRGDLAVISYDDTHAMRLMTAMHKLGIKAPTDYAIVGINNIETAPFCDPPLSSLAQDFDYIGRALLRHAAELGRGGSAQSAESSPHRLVVRRSCGGAGRLDAKLSAELREYGLVLADDTGTALFE